MQAFSFVKCMNLEGNQDTKYNRSTTSMHYVNFEFLMAIHIKIMILWDVMPYSLVHGYQHFTGPAASIFRLQTQYRDNF
jgi:hypothetical protein